jgi:hypothetical protein
MFLPPDFMERLAPLSIYYTLKAIKR